MTGQSYYQEWLKRYLEICHHPKCQQVSCKGLCFKVFQELWLIGFNIYFPAFVLVTLLSPPNIQYLINSLHVSILVSFLLTIFSFPFSFFTFQSCIPHMTSVRLNFPPSILLRLNFVFHLWPSCTPFEWLHSLHVPLSHDRTPLPPLGGEKPSTWFFTPLWGWELRPSAQ